ncbi:hypothetical protein [Teredinibacter sp. KSP-S5-2]|uniref:hypothetical protein n=1 Tax=Teredinibacter sp. KSP-S5-2 TaxID=3034506 RepID=UPI00293457B4|nr:hypothetical protein [Teredinibacter sp. KSP-S5-2]WNO11128.1 hypothetical protein P5V12_08080 [Teredinibacter sp. KSP-S5-2]
MKTKLQLLSVAFLSFFLLTGFGIKDLKDNIKPKTDKCQNSDNKKDCESRKQLQSAAKVAAIGIAAKMIYDMAIDYKSETTSEEKAVINAYKKQNKRVPRDNTVVSYESSLTPGQVVKVGKKVAVVSDLKVIRGRDKKEVLIQERIEIFDNEDPKRSIKTLLKTVNKETKKGGAFKNSFAFVLPQGMPQGVYPIKTNLVIDGKKSTIEKNEMQLVLHIMENGDYRIAQANSQQHLASLN